MMKVAIALILPADTATGTQREEAARQCLAPARPFDMVKNPLARDGSEK